MKIKIIYDVIWKNRVMIDFRRFLNSIRQHIADFNKLKVGDIVMTKIGEAKIIKIEKPSCSLCKHYGIEFENNPYNFSPYYVRRTELKKIKGE